MDSVEIVELVRPPSEYPVIGDSHGLTPGRYVGIVERILASVQEKRHIVVGKLVHIVVAESLLGHQGADIVPVVTQTYLQEELRPLDV